MIWFVAGLDTQWMVPRVSRAGDGGDPGAWCLVTSASNEGYPKVRNHGEGPY